MHIPDKDAKDYWTDALSFSEEKGPFWRCEECGHEDHAKVMPANREAFYERMHKGNPPKCPKCKSEAFVPVGF